MSLVSHGRDVSAHFLNVQNLISNWSDQSPEQWLAQASQRLPFWVCLVLTVVLAWYLARLVWILYPQPTVADWTPPSPSGTVSSRDRQATDYADLQAAQLFGKANAEPAKAQPVEDVLDAPDTRLKLSLRASVASTDDKAAHAIIADDSGKEQPYFIADAIPGGATLHQVHPDRVILNRGGILEALRLPREFSNKNQGRTTSPRRRTAATRPTPTVQEVVQENAASFTEIVRPQPFMPNGQLRGYRVYPGRNRQQFAALGLRPGDLVTEINGMALNNPAEGMQIFRSLGDATQVSLTVERNGQSEVMTLDTSQVDLANGATQ